MYSKLIGKRLTAAGAKLSKFHKMSRIVYTQKYPGKQENQRDQVDLQNRFLYWQRVKKVRSSVIEYQRICVCTIDLDNYIDLD